MFAGFVVSNSETGHGSFSLTPQLTVQICDNGITITKDAMREVHLGARMSDGVIRWAADTQGALLDLVVKQARDAVATFLDHGYVRAKLDQISRRAGVVITDPQATLEDVGKALRFHRRAAGHDPRPLHPGLRRQQRGSVARGCGVKAMALAAAHAA
ncbi:hypothetical protein ACVGOW_13515 [Pseudonocardia saturnea]